MEVRLLAADASVWLEGPLWMALNALRVTVSGRDRERPRAMFDAPSVADDVWRT
jgi:hypothetical protein